MKTILLLFGAVAIISASEFPTPYNTEPDASKLMPAAEAAAKMKLPPGFKATLFAAEPDVQNPIAMAWDSRGRLWVAENYTYAEGVKKYDLNLRDRILIFEDREGDGHFDSRKVFSDELQMLTSIEVVPGGVWAACPPQLIFIPDKDGNDVPDGAPEVVLDGFATSMDNRHTFVNGLRFGPDGWLYGRCGASSAGDIGAPGTPADQRIPLRGSMWRYHPTRKVFEVIGSGTTNPWGHDWDQFGELFFINTVIGHLWHNVPGMHYMRPHTIDPNPHTYDLMDQIANHYHWDNKGAWQQSRAGAADSLGGGHAHIGMMIYQGDNWPTEYRNHLFTLNLHGRRMNQEILERSGSGYVGKHAPDFMISPDPWFRGLELTYGPDGGVYDSDWSDTGECHDTTGIHRTSGRIYKITYGDPKQPTFGDLSKLSSSELVKLHTHSNEWFTRRARLELTARGNDKATAQQLRDLFEKNKDAAIKLRALWTLYCIGAAEPDFLRQQLQNENEHIRAWAVRLLTDHWPLDTVMSRRPTKDVDPGDFENRLDQLARSDKSGLVRLTVASTLQRLPIIARAQTAEILLAHKEDADDHNLPLLIWYGLIPVADHNPDALASVGAKSKIPLTAKLIARRLTEDIEKNPAPLNALLSSSVREPEILAGMSEALTGWRKAKKPEAWEAFTAKLSDPTLQAKARDLSVLFGDGRALDEVKKLALDKKAELGARKVALQTIIDSHAPESRAVCEQLISEQFINAVAARGLSTYDDPAVGARLVRAYRQFHASERPQLLSALVSRASFASALLDAVAEKRIPRSEISAYHARQIRGLNDPALTKKLTETWGELREAAADKKQSIEKWKSQLARPTLAKADLSHGRVVFNATCAQCHTLYGEGGKVGPDLTGGGRENLDYILENVLDPSAIITADFKMSVVELKDGRTLNGLIAAQTDRTLTLKTMTETLTLDRAEITTVRESTLSLMPEGLLDGLPVNDARDLVAYLTHKTQVPLP
jgi:putative membrane-bound dehydrogenase-like protein